MPATSFEAGTICVVSMRVVHGKRSRRVRTAITISSSEAFPARSPRPFTVHSTWRAPFITAARELATATPRSLWQCTDHTARAGIGDALAQGTDERAELPGHGVADGVGNVDGGRAGSDRGLDQAAQEIRLRAPGVLGRELHVVRVLARRPHGLDGLRQNLVGGHAQLHLHVDRRRRDEGMHPSADRRSEGLAAAGDVLLVGPGEAAHHALGDRACDRVNRLPVAVGRGRKARLDDVHPQSLQLLRDPHLLFAGHGGAGALLTVAQGGVEDDEMVHGQVIGRSGIRIGSDGTPGVAAGRGGSRRCCRRHAGGRPQSASAGAGTASGLSAGAIQPCAQARLAALTTARSVAVTMLRSRPTP